LFKEVNRTDPSPSVRIPWQYQWLIYFYLISFSINYRYHVNNEDIVDQVTVLENAFPLSQMTRPNKLECLSLETLSSQVLEFEGKARVNPIVAPGVTSK
jgi:hypothetical protein